MGLTSISGGWRGFSLVKETALGTPQTVDASMNFSGEPMEAEPAKTWTDQDEFTGELAATRQQHITHKLEGKHAQNLMPHNAAIFLAWLTGKITTTDPGDPNQASVRKHLIATDKTAILLPTRTVREYDGANCLEFPGVACAEVTLQGAREDFIKVEASMLGMGKETVITPVPSRPAQASESYLLYGDCNLKLGGTYDGDVVTGGTAISARVRDFKATFKNSAKMDYLFGDATGYGGRVIRGRMLPVDLEMSLEFEDRTEKTKLLSCETFILEIPIVGALIGSSLTNKFTVRLVFPKVCYNKAKRGVDDGLLILNAGFNVLADATYGPYHIHIINEQTQYL